MALNALGLGLLFTAKDLASGVMKNMRNGFAQTRDELGQFGNRSKQTFKEFGVGVAMMGAGLAGLALLSPASAAATEFGQQIARIRTVIDETAFSTEDLRKTTMGLAASYGIDALQQADGLYETISAGIMDAQKATELLEVANEFAVGGTTGLKGAVDVLTSAVNTYADTGLTAASASDLMFTAIAAGKTTATELSNSLGEVAPTAHAAGVSFGELQAAIAALTVQGIKTPQAITGLNAMLANLLKPTSDAEAEAKRLGISFDATALKTKGLQGVLSQLAGNTKINDTTMVKLFGSIDGVKSALALTAGGGAKFNEILEQMKNAGGATGKAFEIMANTTRFQEDRFKALKGNALILIGEGLEPLKVAVLKVVNGLLEGFAKIPKPVREFMVKAFAMASVALTVVGAVIALKSALLIGAAALKTFGIAAGGSFLSALWPALLVIGLVTAAVYAFKYAIDHNLGGIGDRVRTLWANLKLGFEAITQLFTDGGFSGAVRDEFNKGGNPIIDFAIKVYVWAGRIQSFLSGLADGFVAAMAEAEPTFTAFGKALDELGEAFGSFANDPAANGEAFDTAGSKGKSVGQTLGKMAELIVRAITAVIEVTTGFVAQWQSMKGIFDPISQGLDDVGSAFNRVMFEMGLADSEAGSGSGWKAFGSYLATTLAVALAIVGGLLSAVGGIFRGLGMVIGGVVDIIAGVLSGDWDRAWMGAKKVVLGVMMAIGEAAIGIVGIIADMIDAIGKAAGKDLGLGKGLRAWRDESRLSMEKNWGVDAQSQSNVRARASAGGETVPLVSNTTPALATYAGADKTFDPTAFYQAMPKPAPGPPVTITVPVYIDGAEVATSVAKVGTDGRNYSAASPGE